MFNKDVKVPLQEAELVGTSSSNKRKLLNIKKEEKDEKPFTFSCNVGKILGTQPPTKKLLLCFRHLLLQKNLFSKAQKASLIIGNVSHAKEVFT